MFYVVFFFYLLYIGFYWFNYGLFHFYLDCTNISYAIIENILNAINSQNKPGFYLVNVSVRQP